MKILITLLVACAVVAYGKPHHDGSHHGPPPHIKAAHDKCVKELGLTEEQVEERKKSGEIEKEDCLRACVFKELGILNKDGSFNKEKAIENAPPHITKEENEKIVEDCQEKKGANDCETAALLHVCLKKNMPPPPPRNPEMEKVANECKTKLSFSDDDFQKWMNKKEDPKEDCFAACMLKGLGILAEDGSFNKEKALANNPPHTPKEVKEKAVEECKATKGANDCETAALIHKCFKEHHVFDHPPPPPKA